MNITEEQLLIWSTQESTDLSSNAYNFIKDHIQEIPYVKEKSSAFNIYLQGSYANNTNIKRDSDVDIVVQYNDVFRYDDSKLSDAQKKARSEYYSRATLTFLEYKSIIFDGLCKVLSEHDRVKDIVFKPNSIKIVLQHPSIEVDVVPCFLYKKYSTFSLYNPDSKDYYVEGISFDNTKTDEIIVNFPKQHRTNGEDKNQKYRTDGKYKQTIRYIKKIKSLLVDKNYINEKDYSSYFIENLLYNVPDTLFEMSCYNTFKKIVLYLKGCNNLSSFVCQHEQWLLFGSKSTQWEEEKAKNFIEILYRVFNGAYL